MDGFAVTTTDGLGSSVSGFHAVHRRLARFGGSQCGYCTPGMVMTLYSQLKKNPSSTMLELEEAFDGNICRCTGYRPILGAAKSFASDSDVVDDICGTPTGAHDGEGDPAFPEYLMAHRWSTRLHFKRGGVEWIRPPTLADALAVLKSHPVGTVKPVVGNTSIGIYKEDRPRVYLDIQHIPELLGHSVGDHGITVGAATTLEAFIDILRSTTTTAAAPPSTKLAMIPALIRHVRKIAGTHVRGVGSVGGNLMLAKGKGFLSDLATILLAARATTTLVSDAGVAECSMEQFLALPSLASGTLLQSITIPWSSAGTHFNTYKTAIRPQNAHAWVNAGFCFQLADDGTIEDATLAFGGIMHEDQPGSHAIGAPKTSAFLKGKQVCMETLQGALERLVVEVAPAASAMRREFRERLVHGFFYKFFVEVSNAIGSDVDSSHRTATVDLTQRGVSVAQHAFEFGDEHAPISQAHPKKDSEIQAAGEARYVDDIPPVARTLYGYVVQSTRAHAKLAGLDVADALKCRGVRRVVSAEDVAGVNNAAAFLGDDHAVFAQGKVLFHGQPVAVVLATTAAQAKEGARLVRVHYGDVDDDGERYRAVLTIDDALEAIRDGDESYVYTHNEFSIGDAKSMVEKGPNRVQGVVQLGTQKHFYMETSAAYALPEEDGGLQVHASTQWPDAVHTAVSMATGVAANKVRVLHRRCGGAFGGKHVHSAHVCSMAAVCAVASGAPVRLALDRNQDMKMVGGREEARSEYDVAFDDEGRITACVIHSWLNSGFSKTLSFFTNMSFAAAMNEAYQFDHFYSGSTLLRTHQPSRTVVRGPGEIGASFVIEQVLEHVAHATGRDAHAIRELNMYDAARGQELMVVPNGAPIGQFSLDKVWARAKERTEYDAAVARAREYNGCNRWKKRGVGLIPVRYQVSIWPKSAVVNVYGDGTVMIIHGGSEMGQGLNMKTIQMACFELGRVLDVKGGIPLELVRCGDIDTFTVPNATFTGGSTGSEGTAAAVQQACSIIGERLRPVLDGLVAKAEEGDAGEEVSWQALCMAAKGAGINLSAIGTWTDASVSYQNWGAGLSVVELDVLTGETSIVRTDIVYDCGKSLNPSIDIGQVEGAFMMGVGAILREHELQEPSGKLVSEGTWEYKPPCAKDVPLSLNIELLQGSTLEKGILSSKSSGEPPLVLANSVTIALRQALASARKDAGMEDHFTLPCPITPDVLQSFTGADLSSYAL